MKIPCKFCRRRMEPVKVINNYYVSTYYCSVCGQQLFTTKGIRRFYGISWIFNPFHALIELIFGKIFDPLKERRYGKIIYLVIAVIFAILMAKFHHK